MIEFGGQHYYIDFDAIDNLIASDKSLIAQEIEEIEISETIKDVDGTPEKTTHTVTRRFPKGKEIDGSKYDIMNLMLQIIVGTPDEHDDTLGGDRALAKTTLNYKIAFNTLIKYGILAVSED